MPNNPSQCQRCRVELKTPEQPHDCRAEILRSLAQWRDRHAGDRDDYVLNTFLTVGGLRVLLTEPEDESHA